MAAGRPGRARSETSRRSILEATRDELARNGYDKLSTDRIAGAAGVGIQTIYRWYPTKSALVAECILFGHLSPTISVLNTGDVRADITSWLLAFAAGSADPEAAALLRATAAAAAENEAVAAQYEEQVTTVTRAALAERIADGIEAGQIRPDAPAAIVVEALLGAVLLRVLTRQVLTPALVADLVDLVFAGISTSPTMTSDVA